MPSRKHVHQEDFDATAEQLFALLITPSAIRGWWGCATAIVLPDPGGLWAATWGADEDRPDYVTLARIAHLDPPRKLVLDDYRYRSKDGPLPFAAQFVTSFEVEPLAHGARLRVIQDGFPADPGADEFYAACDTGWRATFAGIRRHLDRASS